MKNSSNKNNAADPTDRNKKSSAGILDGVDPVQIAAHWARMGLDCLIKV